jgi:transcriptional regulator with XRE-family HTH domain
VDTAGECLVLHLFAYAGDFDACDRLVRLDERAGCKEAGEFVAGEKGLVEMGDAGHAGILRVAEDGRSDFNRPAQPLKFADADEGMLCGGGVALVVEVVEQAGGYVQFKEPRAVLFMLGAGEADAVGFGLTAGGDADFHCKCMLAQALALGPLGQQLPSLFAAEALFSILSAGHNYFFSVLLPLVRDSSGFPGYDRAFLGLSLSFYLTIMVHFPESITYRGAKKRPGVQALALRIPNMATTLVSVETREVLRCDYCSLVQYRTSNSLCRKCHRPLDIEEPAVLTPQLVSSTPPAAASAEAGLQVAGQVRELRRARHLSQRQLASRMQVPRTYISKIENGKAIPTLGSLERLAGALEVDMRQLVRDSRSRREEEVASILSDPFLAEIAALLPHLDSLHRTLLYGSVRDMASGRRRTA